MSNINLLSSMSRVETPVVSVQIGDYSFGVITSDTPNKVIKSKYPNYIQSLQVEKINGQVNKYTLRLDYPIAYGDDPNFFEKVFASASKDRTIFFTYGDMSTPSFLYRREEATILKVSPSFDIQNSKLSYTVSAISKAALVSVGTHHFPAKTAQPSEEIKRLLKTNAFGLTDVFFGMKNYNLVLSRGLIPGDDKEVFIEDKTTDVLTYLSYLVTIMRRVGSNDSNLLTSSNYNLIVIDDTSGEFNGPYFKIVKCSTDGDSLTTYDIDIGFPSSNIVTSFNVNVDKTYSLLYDYQEKISSQKYVTRIDDEGKLSQVFAPAISSNNNQYQTNETDRSWWSKVTQFPIGVNITIKGLLRPAILMSYVRLNVYFYGQKYLYSGLYIITKQVDTIDYNGYRTELTMTRVGGDNSYDY